VFGELRHLDPRPAELSWLEEVHTKDHIDRVRRAARNAPTSLDPDTAVSRESFDVALLAAGALLTACDEIMEGRAERAFCAVRPPGHHAEADRAMGFCLFNNVAVAARYLQKRHGVDRVFIIDWDVHHGNGTQHIFYDDPTVFYFSVHQYPFYPGTGSAEERGEGEGLGTTLNVPLSAGQDDGVYRRVFEEQLVPALRRFRPGFVLISAGFDAHKDDPLGGMQVTEQGFATLTTLVCEAAEDVAGGRIVSVLEGGYNLEALARSAEAHLRALWGTETQAM
jgi:acetoin utilization deacetylase AcuC-like enzyme